MMLVHILVLAVSVAVVAGLVLHGTGTVSKPVSTAMWLALLGLVGSAGFVTLAGLSGAG